MKSDEVAYELLQNLGYAVEVISTSDNEQKKEADFLICYKNIVAIVEAKLKEDDPNIINEKERNLVAGEVSIVEGKLGRNEIHSGIINKATKQLISSGDKEHDFKIISFIATGSNVKTKADQFKDTIYGSTLIMESSDSVTTSKICYFFRNADFYRKKEIDAAIVSYILNDKIITQLCLNPYSKKFEVLRNSIFLEPFNGAVIDPIQLENQGLAYIPDADVERTLNDFHKLSPVYSPILQHLTKKYNTGFLVGVDFDSPELSIRTNKEE
ncbi:hypothetical protein [Shewanella sp. 10N.286.48.B5]|uniref:hypothetical protein n=1 Tax=Shewanella sp. 10N.286.48.B5 TaxID=1880834 RepID=UPI000C81FCFA|nr:hypothetical protein [Shewanella sp. 10N.286.48.B5]PMH88538.1 hypothetical protein BCU57_19865 [Shewanella sp. 10N.286.48.B5]